jgi:hypothetical protein
MSATLPRISEFPADTGDQYSIDVKTYTEKLKRSKKELDEVQAVYDRCKIAHESYLGTIRAKVQRGKPVNDEKTRRELAGLMTNEGNAKTLLENAQARYDVNKKALHVKLTAQIMNRNLAAARSPDSGAGVMSMQRVDPASPNLEVSGTGTVAVAASAQRSSSPEPTKGCWSGLKGWVRCMSKKRDDSPSSKTPSSKTKNAGGRKYKSKRFKTKRTYKKRRTSRK